MNAGKLNLERTALLLLDMQNDFLHIEGAYGRNGISDPAMDNLPAVLRRVADVVVRANGWLISTHFTLVSGKDGIPFISRHLAQLRPFLTTGDFAPGSWGQDLIEELKPVHCQVEKVAFSAFYQSRLEFVLHKCRVENLIFGGIVTNGGVASTVRDAHVRDYRCFVLSDGCAAFSSSAHNSTLESLSTIASVLSSEELITRI